MTLTPDEAAVERVALRELLDCVEQFISGLRYTMEPKKRVSDDARSMVAEYDYMLQKAQEKARAALEIAAAPAPGDAWRDISTAPKDGSRVLIAWRDKSGEWHQRAAVWEADYAHAGWTDHAVKSFGYEEIFSYKPTHWQPLPAPPASRRAQGAGA